MAGNFEMLLKKFENKHTVQGLQTGMVNGRGILWGIELKAVMHSTGIKGWEHGIRAMELTANQGQL